MINMLISISIVFDTSRNVLQNKARILNTLSMFGIIKIVSHKILYSGEINRMRETKQTKHFKLQTQTHY